jgi:hypothetical protein
MCPITNDARRTREIISNITMANVVFNKYKTSLTRNWLNVRNKLVTCCIWSTAFIVLKRKHFRKQFKKPETYSDMVLEEDGEDHLEWSCRKKDVLHGVKEERNTLRTIKMKANWLGHILCRNCLLKYVIDDEIKETGRGVRGSKQLLSDLKEMTRYWKLKEKALDRCFWRTRSERSMDLS